MDAEIKNFMTFYSSGLSSNTVDCFSTPIASKLWLVFLEKQGIYQKIDQWSDANRKRFKKHMEKLHQPQPHSHSHSPDSKFYWIDTSKIKVNE